MLVRGCAPVGRLVLRSSLCKPPLAAGRCTQRSQHRAALVDAPAGPDAAPDSSTDSLDEHEERRQQQAEASTSYDPSPEESLPTIQLNLPRPESSRVKQATFVKSSIQVADCPPPKYPDFAVIGRSNVGKSSLINMLTNRKSLALVSKEPGKTRLINHFIINNEWYLVDLPGYGYARIGKDSRRQFDSFTKQYFLERKNLAMVLQLVDSSIPPQDMDLGYSAWLAENSVPFTLVFTKADKRKKGARGQSAKNANMLAYKRALLQERGFTLLPPSLVTSAANGMGKDELLRFLSSLRLLFEEAKKA